MIHARKRQIHLLMRTPHWTHGQSVSLKASDLTFRLRIRLRLAKAPHFEQGIFLGANWIFMPREGASASMPATLLCSVLMQNLCRKICATATRSTTDLRAVSNIAELGRKFVRVVVVGTRSSDFETWAFSSLVSTCHRILVGRCHAVVSGQDATTPALGFSYGRS